MGSPPTKAARSGYFYSLDGWRAIAVLLVIFSHDSWNLPGFDPGFVRGFGSWGVDLFFAISGILICSRLLEEEAQLGKINLRGFYIRRIFRIQPAALFYLLTVIILAVFHVLPLSVMALVSALFFFRNYYGISDSTAAVDHFWSLSMEEQFYLLLPAFLLLCRKKRVIWMGIAIAVLASWAALEPHLHLKPFGPPYPGWRTDLSLCSLLIPALCAVLLAKPKVRFHLKRWINPYTAITATGFLSLWFHFRVGAMSALAINYLPYPLLILGTLLHPESLLTRFLELRPMKFIGHISYSLYLWQELVIYCTIQLGPSPGLGFLRLRLLRYACLFLVAAASYFLLERPLIRVGHRLAPPVTPGRDDVGQVVAARPPSPPVPLAAALDQATE